MQWIGDHLTLQHIIYCDGLAMENRFRVSLSVGALVSSNFRERPLIIAIGISVSLSNQRVADILGHIAVGHIELCLG